MTKWFGTPWPAPNRRAPVCRDDADRVPIPVGASCPECTQMIAAGDRGVLIPHLHADERLGQRAYHLLCYLRMGLGPGLAEMTIAEMERDAVIPTNELLRARAEERRAEGETFEEAVRHWMRRHLPRTPDEWTHRGAWVEWMAANLVADPELAPHLFPDVEGEIARLSDEAIARILAEGCSEARVTYVQPKINNPELWK